MPFTQVMHKFGAGNLHSGSKHGPTVKNPKQAIAIMESEKRSGKSEYKSHSMKGLELAARKK